ncbi:hypothetical protein JCM14469_12170 [Desulfatiferula olefinivorans]
MTPIRYAILMLLALMASACGDDNLPEDHVVVDYKILAVRIEAPEASPGDTVSMKLLIGGSAMDQDSVMPVTWRINDPDGDVFHEEIVPYNEEFVLDLPAGILNGNPWLDVPVTSSVALGSRSLSALKRFRITPAPVGANPVISGISADWLSGDTHHTRSVMTGDTVTVDRSVLNIAFTAEMAVQPENAIDSPVYSWYVTRSDPPGGELEVDDRQTVIESLLGEGAQAAEFRQSVVFSLYGENAEGSFQKGRYTVYLVVRDNAARSSDVSSDRLGTNFFYFSLAAQ